MLKRFLCFILALLLPCAALADYTMAGLDEAGTYRDWTTNRFFQRMEEMTGVRFTYRQYTDAGKWREAKAAMQATDADLPDVLFKADLTGQECMELRERGVLIDLKPYLAENCPNLTALLQAHPEFEQAITLPDGSIAALPSISDQPLQNCVWLNRSWLKTLGLDMPTTAEELTAVLRAMREGDPNRNGKKDEVPLAFLGAFDLKFLGHAFGLVANDYNLREQDGQAVFVPLEENFRPFVEWLRALYAEELIDPQGFATSDTLRTVQKDTETNVYGGLLSPLPTSFLPAAWAEQYAVMPPLTYDGQAVYRSFVGPLISGTFAVTAACKDPAALLRWVDLFYTEEVYILASTGAENVDYVIDGDGTWRLTANAQNNTYFSGETLLSSGTAYPGHASDAFQRRYYDQNVTRLSEELAQVNAVAVRPFPYVTLTAEQAARVAPLQSALGRLVDESIARWVTGEIPISDETFADFERQLRDAGLDEFMALWQDVLDGRNK